MFAQLPSLFLRSAIGQHGARALGFLHFMKCSDLQWEARRENPARAQVEGADLSPKHNFVEAQCLALTSALGPLGTGGRRREQPSPAGVSGNHQASLFLHIWVERDRPAMASNDQGSKLAAVLLMAPLEVSST